MADGTHKFLAKAAGYDEADEEYADDFHTTQGMGEDETPYGEEQWEEDERKWGESETVDDAAAAAETDAAYNYTEHEPEVEQWVENTDSEGNHYYVNETTGESRWEAPEWVEELDKATGCKYYVKLEPIGAQALHSTWSRPDMFARLKRHDHEEGEENENENEEYY